MTGKTKKEIVYDLKAVNKTLRSILTELVKAELNIENNVFCLNRVKGDIRELKKVSTGAYGNLSYNVAIEDALALIEGFELEYINDNYS